MGVVGGWGGLFVQPQQQPSDGVGTGEAEKKGQAGVQRGRTTPASFTFGVNKV